MHFYMVQHPTGDQQENLLEVNIKTLKFVTVSLAHAVLYTRPVLVVYLFVYKTSCFLCGIPFKLARLPKLSGVVAHRSITNKMRIMEGFGHNKTKQEFPYNC
jgi:hypothetical protein